jgi:hypothetical protein
MNNKALAGTQFFALGAEGVLYKAQKGWIFPPGSLSKGLRCQQ